MVAIKMFAGTDVGLRENNEDNFTVCLDLTLGEWIVPADQQQAIPLGKRGCIMVVADGMGGQNAGEVASRLAIETVHEMFSPRNLPADVLESSNSIKNYLKKVISEADLNIKSYTKQDANTSGMGSTIVMAWLIGNTAYVAWLGDSRAYSYIPQKGIGKLSKDHSYVQQLIDSGANLTEEEAMNHPHSNVITRSLGDTSQKAKADVIEHVVEDGEIILLCSDGLCGVCTDGRIGGILDDNKENLQQCNERLSTEALASGGSDNITIALLQVFTDEKNDGSVKISAAVEGLMGKYMNYLRTCSIRVKMALVSALLLCICLVFCLYPNEKEIPLPSISEFWIEETSLKRGESTKYHVVINNKAETASLEVIPDDNNLVIINKKDSTISWSYEDTLKVNKTVKLTAIVCSEAIPCDTFTINVVLEKDFTSEVLDDGTVGSLLDEVSGQVDGSGNQGGSSVSGNGTSGELTSSDATGPGKVEIIAEKDSLNNKKNSN